jgi:hypothetical protein
LESGISQTDAPITKLPDFKSWHLLLSAIYYIPEFTELSHLSIKNFPTIHMIEVKLNRIKCKTNNNVTEISEHDTSQEDKEETSALQNAEKLKRNLSLSE